MEEREDTGSEKLNVQLRGFPTGFALCAVLPDGFFFVGTFLQCTRTVCGARHMPPGSPTYTLGS